VRIDLPSGAWVEIADRRKGNLAGRVTGAVSIEVQDGRTLIPGDIGVRQTDAFLRETITDWSLAQPPPDGLGIPIPKTPGPGGMDRADVIGDELDEDDYAALHDAVREIVVKVLGRSRPNPPSTRALSGSS
jgi:hypothetical protein